MNSRSVSLRNETLSAAVRPSSETGVRRKGIAGRALAQRREPSGSLGISSISGRISIQPSAGTQRNDVTRARLFTSRTSASFAIRSLTWRRAPRFSAVNTSEVSIAITKISSSPKSRVAAR
jgi:hypothetical protein